MGYWSQMRETVMEAGLGLMSVRNVSPAKCAVRALRSRYLLLSSVLQPKGKLISIPLTYGVVVRNPRYDK